MHTLNICQFRVKFYTFINSLDLIYIFHKEYIQYQSPGKQDFKNVYISCPFIENFLGFFLMLQTYLVGFIKPQNKLCINLEVPISYYFQYKWPYRSCLFHLIPARYDHDHRFNGAFVEAFSTQSLFQTYPKCVSRHTWDTQLIKKRREKK